MSSWCPLRSPTWSEAFIVFLSIRLLAVFFAPISDCDEVFNYWEPTHLMLEGYGFQTWEYRSRFLLSLFDLQKRLKMSYRCGQSYIRPEKLLLPVCSCGLCHNFSIDLFLPSYAWSWDFLPKNFNILLHSILAGHCELSIRCYIM